MKSTALPRSLSFAASDAIPTDAPPASLSSRLPFLVGLARTRLFQFVVVGGLVFAASSRGRDSSTIALSGSDLEGRRDAELRKKPLSAVRGDVAASVSERAVEDEILYREGVKLGFDRNDAIIKARVIQKTLFLAEELAGASEPAFDADLRRFYETSKERWRRPEQWRVVQIFARERSTLDAIRDEVNAHAGDLAALGRLGEPSSLPREATLSRPDAITTLGSELVAALPAEPSAGFSQPLHSLLGWHLVRVVAHEPESQSSFEEVRGSLRGLLAIQRREDAVSAYLQHAFPEYDVTVDGERVTSLRPTGRHAVRKSGSAED